MTQKIRRDYPEYYTTTEFADLLGKSKSTVERWRKVKFFRPKHSINMGSTRVWLYSPEDLENAKELLRAGGENY